MSGKKNQRKVIPMKGTYDVKAEAEKNRLGKRLNEARRERGLSLNALANELTAYNIHVQSTAVYKWEQGETTPNSYQLFALCRFFGIEDGIRYFSGPLRPGENALNEQGLKKVKEYTEDLLATGKYSYVNLDDTVSEEIERPLYDFPVSAGPGTFLDDDNYRMESFKANTVPEKADFALTVSGDSMTPNYTDGQMVWVQRTPELSPGEIGIFILNECGYMKMYTEAAPEKEELENYLDSDGTLRNKIELVSLNKKYAPITVGEFDDFRIVGRVLTR